MISADVKADVKQEEIKELESCICVLQFFKRKNLQNLKYNSKQAHNFYLFLVVIPSNVTLSAERTEGRFT